MGIRCLWLASLAAVACGKVNQPPTNNQPDAPIVAPTCDPAFTVSASPTAGMPVVFTPTHTDGATYAWTFDGGTPATSTDEIASTTFAMAGTHTATLAVTNGSCTMSSQQMVDVAAQNIAHGTMQFDATGAAQMFVVPAGVTSIMIDAYGAQGGNASGTMGAASGGKGGRATGTATVTPGETLVMMVGGRGIDAGAGMTAAYPGGFNGGGGVHEYIGWTSNTEAPSGTGGGASDVRRGGNALANRIIVAGGGGGAGNTNGGDGGGTTGGAGVNGSGNNLAGGGGTQNAGGSTNNTLANYPNTPGTLGQGGETYRDGAASGGGGGGYYGGGGGQFAGGGGGSSYIVGLTAASTTAAVQTGPGKIIITW